MSKRIGRKWFNFKHLLLIQLYNSLIVYYKTYSISQQKGRSCSMHQIYGSSNNWAKGCQIIERAWSISSIALKKGTTFAVLASSFFLNVVIEVQLPKGKCTITIWFQTFFEKKKWNFYFTFFVKKKLCFGQFLCLDMTWISPFFR